MRSSLAVLMLLALVAGPVLVKSQGFDFDDCPDWMFECESPEGQCIVPWKQCNGVRDCLDGSDEDWEECFDDKRAANVKRDDFELDDDCPNGMFECEEPEGTCIMALQLCNGIVDCPDRSDEDWDNCEDFFSFFDKRAAALPEKKGVDQAALRKRDAAPAQ